MVSPTCYSAVDIRRYSNRAPPPYAPPYPVERRITTYSHHDPRAMMGEREPMHEEPSTQRKRIAVACGRCRKRKIRCTGDNGTGQPCVNCKNAGFEPCQFLRVASSPMKIDPFTYPLDVSRHYQAGGASMVSPSPHSITSYSDTLSMPSSEALPYRNGSAYGYPGRSMYPISGLPSGYAEDAIDYSMYPQQQAQQRQPSPQQSQSQPQTSQPQSQEPQQTQSYQTVPETSYLTSYRVAPSAAPAAKPSSNNALYVESESNYSYTSGASAASLVQRPASNTTDSSNYSFQNGSTGFSTFVAGSDRVLPTPTPRPLSTTGNHPYRAESISSGYSKTSQSSNGGSSPATLSDAATSYGSFGENSPMPTSYPSASLSSHTSRQNGVYTTSSTSQSEASLPTNDEPLRATAPEFDYKYHDTSGHYRSTYNDNLRYSGTAHSYLPPTHGHTNSYMVGGDVSTTSMEHNRKPDHHPMRP